MVKGDRIPGLIVLSTVALPRRRSSRARDGQPRPLLPAANGTTALVGLAFLASVPLGKPLASGWCTSSPLDASTKANPVLRNFFAHVSVLWAATSLVNAGVTLWLLLTQSTYTFVLVKSFLGPITTTFTLGVAALWFRYDDGANRRAVVYARVGWLAG